MQFDPKKREFIALFGGAVAWPLAALAQQSKRIGVLVTFTQDDADAQSFVHALLQRLGDLGWKEGRNLSIEYRWGAAERSRAQGLAQELVDHCLRRPRCGRNFTHNANDPSCVRPSD